MTWLALLASVLTAASGWLASPARAPSDSRTRRRHAGVAFAGMALTCTAWTAALGWVAGLCAALSSVGAGCSLIPFVIEGARRVRARLCRAAS